MANERETAFRLPQSETKKGQMMLIYLPEGSVIVDRNNVDMNDTMRAAHDPFTAASMAGPSIFQNATRTVHPEMVTVDPAYVPSGMGRGERLYLRRRRRINWLHVINLHFASYIAIVSVVPLLLSALFGISIFTAKSHIINGNIQSGQLLVAHEKAVAQLSKGDLVLFRSATSWRLLVRQVTDLTTTGASTTISTNSGANTALTEVFTLDNYAQVRYVSSYIPFLGFVTMFFSYLGVKVLVVLGVLFANIFAFYRRRMALPRDDKMIYVSR